MNLQTINLGQPVNWSSPLNRGLLAWWLAMPSRNRGSRWFDLGNRYAGTLTNMDPASDWVSAKRPGGFGALDFDGGNDVVTATDSTISGLANFSCSAWVYARTTGGGGFGRIVGGGNADGASFLLLVQSSTTLNFIVTTGVNVISGTTWSLNAWHHVAGTYDGATLRIYLNGVQSNTASSATTIGSTGGIIRIGNNGSVARGFDGLIDDIRLAARTWSASEVAAIYQDSPLGYPQSLNWIRSRSFIGEAAAPVAGNRRRRVICGAAA